MLTGFTGNERHGHRPSGARAALAVPSAAWTLASDVRTFAVSAPKLGFPVANPIDLDMPTTQRPKEAPR
ncbi:MAG: hypothetical protein HYX34_00745 [Actinobacteria bacterium]|nr:hypothetical protein [Actinomycetota bacterium]